MTSGLETDRPILVSALHKFVTYLLTYTLTHILTAPGPTRGLRPRNYVSENPATVRPRLIVVFEFPCTLYNIHVI